MVRYMEEYEYDQVVDTCGIYHLKGISGFLKGNLQQFVLFYLCEGCPKGDYMQ